MMKKMLLPPASYSYQPSDPVSGQITGVTATYDRFFENWKTSSSHFRCKLCPELHDFAFITQPVHLF